MASDLIRRLRENDATLLEVRWECEYGRFDELCDALKVNTALQTLDVSYNELGDDGVRALSDALKVNTALQSLDVSGNQFGVYGARALGDAVKVNTVLQTLDVRGNWIGIDGARAFSDALKVNYSLCLLRFCCANAASGAISALLRRNRRYKAAREAGSTIKAAR